MDSSNMLDMQKLVEASGLELTENELVELIVQQYTMSQPELAERFRFSNQRISIMREQGLLREIKKGLYLREEVELMRTQQIKGKRLEKYGDYKLIPAYDDYLGTLIIDQLRMFDCLSCVSADSKKENYDPQLDEYNIHLTEVFNTVVSAYEEGKDLYLFEHRAFQHVRKEEDIQEVLESGKYWFYLYSVDEFLGLIQGPTAGYLGWNQIMNYDSTVEALKKCIK